MLTVDYIAKFGCIWFHSCLFELCISTVYTLTICSRDAGPEQSLVLFFNSIDFHVIFHFVRKFISFHLSYMGEILKIYFWIQDFEADFP